MSESTRSPAVAFWVALPLLAALLLLPAGWRNLRPLAIDVESPGIPEIEGPEGTLPVPPREFRWTPGGDDVEWSQVLLYRATFERLWESPPLTEPVFPVDPREVFRGIPAGEEVWWKVREIADGRARAASRLVRFTFEVDAFGHGPGEAPTYARPLVD
ncbi:MAG: hypothetical protein R3B81_03155 [bacterium]